jgi:hypothetical protein
MGHNPLRQDSFVSREKKRVLTPQRKTTDPQEGKERNSKDYNLCNTGKPINGGVCE